MLAKYCVIIPLSILVGYLVVALTAWEPLGDVERWEREYYWWKVKAHQLVENERRENVRK